MTGATSILDGAGIVPVLRCANGDDAAAIGRWLGQQGFATIEVALTTPGALAAIEALSDLDGLIVGAGTVLQPRQVRDAASAGARFCVSPGCLSELVGAASIEVILGAGTPTEVIEAQRAGSRVVKLFPACALGGPDFLRALLGPLPGLRAFPTGGITADGAGAWLEAGAVAVGLGSGLVPASPHPSHLEPAAPIAQALAALNDAALLSPEGG